MIESSGNQLALKQPEGDSGDVKKSARPTTTAASISPVIDESETTNGTDQAIQHSPQGGQPGMESCIRLALVTSNPQNFSRPLLAPSSENQNYNAALAENSLSAPIFGIDDFANWLYGNPALQQNALPLASPGTLGQIPTRIGGIAQFRLVDTNMHQEQMHIQFGSRAVPSAQPPQMLTPRMTPLIRDGKNNVNVYSPNYHFSHSKDQY
jgi:hypothetical protein